MSQDQDSRATPAQGVRSGSWKMIVLRAAGFGGGFAIVAAILLGGVIWYSQRPKEWSDKSITAKPTELMIQQAGEELRFEFRYAFTNHTNAEYTLPSADMGALMRKLPKDSSFDKMSGATWDGTLRIPPQQSIGVTFTVPYQLSDYDTSASDLAQKEKLTSFAADRLEKIDGFVFFDYASKYKVEMPRQWDQPKQQQTTKEGTQKSEPILPPDKGDMVDKVVACEEADKLLDRCRHANISTASSPGIKEGWWPTKLGEIPTPPSGYTLDPAPDVCVTAAEWHNYCKAKVK